MFYDMTWLERLLFLKRTKGGSGHEETTTSNTFVTDMVAPLRKLLLSFAPKQSGSGDPSPTNIRPISGWDGVSVVRSTDYEPYAGQTYSASWQTEAGTVYGGTLDMVSGVLTVDRAMIDLGTGVNSWTYYSAQSYFYAIPPHRFINGQSGDGLCESYAFFGTKSSASASSLPDKSFMFTSNAGNRYIYVKDTDYTTAADFKTAVTGKKLVYTLDEPIVYQLTPQQINTLIGTNVITTDANVVEIIYLKKAE